MKYLFASLICLLVAGNAYAGGPCATDACIIKATTAFEKCITKVDTNATKKLFHALLVRDFAAIDRLQFDLYPQFLVCETKLADKEGDTHENASNYADQDTAEAVQMGSVIIDGWNFQTQVAGFLP